MESRAVRSPPGTRHGRKRCCLSLATAPQLLDDALQLLDASLQPGNPTIRSRPSRTGRRIRAGLEVLHAIGIIGTMLLKMLSNYECPSAMGLLARHLLPYLMPSYSSRNRCIGSWYQGAEVRGPPPKGTGQGPCVDRN